MKKTCEYYVDLWPGWQDSDHCPAVTEGCVNSVLFEGYRRVKVRIEFECFGGSADVSKTINAEVETHK